MRWFWEQYGVNGDEPLASPLRAVDLAGLPPTQIITAEVDPLRDEGLAFAARLRQAGVETLDQPVAGVMHGFFSLIELLPEASMACASVIQELRRRFLTFQAP